MQALKKQIKEKSLEGIYIFIGEETYVKDIYIDIMINTLLSKEEQGMNLDVFTSDSNDFGRMADAMDTLPFLADKRVVVIKNKQLLKKKMASKVSAVLEAIGRMPDTTLLIIADQELDKSSEMYKKLKVVGKIVEFKALDEADLIKVIAKNLGKFGLEIDVKTARYMIEFIGDDLTLLNQEVDKLCSYKLNQSRITIEDIEVCCTKSLENKIFDLMDAIGRKDKGRAIKLYHDLLVSKVMPMSILSMITRQFRINLQCMLLERKNSNLKEIAALVKIPYFVVRKSLDQTRHFSLVQLENSLEDCLQVEMSFKKGEINQNLALELLIIEYSS